MIRSTATLVLIAPEIQSIPGQRSLHLGQQLAGVIGGLNTADQEPALFIAALPPLELFDIRVRNFRRLGPFVLRAAVCKLGEVFIRPIQ